MVFSNSLHARIYNSVKPMQITARKVPMAFVPVVDFSVVPLFSSLFVVGIVVGSTTLVIFSCVAPVSPLIGLSCHLETYFQYILTYVPIFGG